MDRRKPVMNRGEVVAEKAIAEAALRYGAHVRSKLKLSDVLEIGRSGLSRAEFDYATRAHLDFVVLDDQHLPQFAVELDGAQHRTDAATIARDRMKNGICERLGLLLLRIDSDYLRTEGRFTLIGWLIEVWFMQEAFYKLASAPVDEPFIYFNVYERGEDGRLRQAYALDADAVALLGRAAAHGHVGQTYPETITSPFGHGEFTEAYALVTLRHGGHVIGHARLRDFRPFGIGPWELVGDLAVADLGRKLKQVLGRERPPDDDAKLRRLREQTAGWTRQGQFAPDRPLQQSRRDGDA